MQYLYRDIKGRRENLSPLFIIGGRYRRKNPFFENRIKMQKNEINVDTLLEIMESDTDIKENTFVGVMSDIFDNDSDIKKKLSAKSVGETFKHLKEEVETYYGEGN